MTQEGGGMFLLRMMHLGQMIEDVELAWETLSRRHLFLLPHRTCHDFFEYIKVRNVTEREMYLNNIFDGDSSRANIYNSLCVLLCYPELREILFWKKGYADTEIQVWSLIIAAFLDIIHIKKERNITEIARRTRNSVKNQLEKDIHTSDDIILYASDIIEFLAYDYVDPCNEIASESESEFKKIFREIERELDEEQIAWIRGMIKMSMIMEHMDNPTIRYIEISDYMKDKARNIITEIIAQKFPSLTRLLKYKNPNRKRRNYDPSCFHILER